MVAGEECEPLDPMRRPMHDLHRHPTAHRKAGQAEASRRFVENAFGHAGKRIEAEKVRHSDRAAIGKRSHLFGEDEIVAEKAREQIEKSSVGHENSLLLPAGIVGDEVTLCKREAHLLPAPSQLHRHGARLPPALA